MAFANSWCLGWASRLYHGSIYRSDGMVEALSGAFLQARPLVVYGMSNHARVAVTTTVGVDGRLIANYNRGGSGIYLNSELPLWKAYATPTSYLPSSPVVL